nr:MAG TPA: hypothetical protein [Caudoviricetes sp.]
MHILCTFGIVHKKIEHKLCKFFRRCRGMSWPRCGRL